MEKYYDLKDFEHLYLEDSFVLDICEKEDTISFTIDLVLNEKHPYYSEPNDDEQYCYKKGKINFNNCEFINWTNKSLKQFTDKNEEIDLGNIDFFTKSKNKYTLSGDWGEVEIGTNSVEIRYL